MVGGQAMIFRNVSLLLRDAGSYLGFFAVDPAEPDIAIRPIRSDRE
jgi:hypothetical protein